MNALLRSTLFDRPAAELSAAARCGAAHPGVAERFGEYESAGNVQAAISDLLSLATQAREGAAPEHRGGTRAVTLLRHAATYYSAAQDLVSAGELTDEETLIGDLQRECWDRIVEATGRRLSIATAEALVDAYFFPATTSREHPPTVIVALGHSTPPSQAWVHGGAAAAARGYHWLTFDQAGYYCPGRQRLLQRDAESILTPILDAVQARDDVDPGRVVLVGAGTGSYTVARTLAFEHRFAAAAVAPAIVDLSAPWLAALPGPARYCLDAGDREGFDRQVRLAEMFTPGLTAALRRHGTAYCPAGASHFEIFTAVQRFRLGVELADIRTPLLIGASNDPHWAGQATLLAQRVGPAQTLDSTGETFAWLAQHLEGSPARHATTARRQREERSCLTT